MEFGKIGEEELAKLDLSLPPDPSETSGALNSGKGKTKFYVGCAKWGRKDWVGKLYPKGTKEKDFLQSYAGIFNCIEFNATFYRAPSPEQVRKWRDKVPKDFLFCPKFPQTITHLKRLKNVNYELGAYLEALYEFKDTLGPIFLLPNPQMSPKQLDIIQEFIADFPRDLPLFLELRHPDWYRAPEVYHPELYHFLQQQQRGTIITDAAGRRDCVHMHLSTPEAFIRFVGNSLHPSPFTLQTTGASTTGCSALRAGWSRVWKPSTFSCISTKSYTRPNL